jgi:hypothetical protein
MVLNTMIVKQVASNLFTNRKNEPNETSRASLGPVEEKKKDEGLGSDESSAAYN